MPPSDSQSPPLARRRSKSRGVRRNQQRIGTVHSDTADSRRRSVTILSLLLLDLSDPTPLPVPSARFTFLCAFPRSIRVIHLVTYSSLSTFDHADLSSHFPPSDLTTVRASSPPFSRCRAVMSYTAVRELSSRAESPESALEEPELEDEPATDNIHQQHLPHPSLPPDPSRLLLDPAQFAPDSAALQAEAELEAEHEEAVDEQLGLDSDGAAAAPPSILTDTGSLESGSAVLPEPSPGTLALEAENIMGKPSEMSAEELKEHMADVAERVAADVKEMEERKQQGPARHDQIVINPGKHDKLIRTLFGFTVHCKCTINDEVRMTVWILLIVGCLCGFAFFVADIRSTSFDTGSLRLHERVVAISIGGVFSFLATVLSIIQIRAHHRNWVHPPSQRCVVRILLMVPVYSISAWLSLVFLQYSLYIDFVRMCYEAFVIYTFMILLTKYLGGHNGVVEWMKTKVCSTVALHQLLRHSTSPTLTI